MFPVEFVIEIDMEDGFAKSGSVAVNASLFVAAKPELVVTGLKNVDGQLLLAKISVNLVQ